MCWFGSAFLGDGLRPRDRAAVRIFKPIPNAREKLEVLNGPVGLQLYPPQKSPLIGLFWERERFSYGAWGRLYAGSEPATQGPGEVFMCGEENTFSSKTNTFSFSSAHQPGDDGLLII